MALKNLKENINKEGELVKELIDFNSKLENSKDDKEKKLLEKKIISTKNQLKIINNALPKILEGISPYQKFNEREEEIKNLVRLEYESDKGKSYITLTKTQKEEFIKELNISEEILKRLKKKTIKKEKAVEFKKPNFYAKLANKLFLNYSIKLFERGKLKKLDSSLKKANMPWLATTYFSTILLTTLLSIFFGILLFIFFSFFSFSLAPPSIGMATTTLQRFILSFSIVIFLPILTFFSLYYYPYLEGKGMEKRINAELPFVTIHMSSIAGSGIEPTQIFKIITQGEEYPYTKKELKKVINQVNVYGYDLISALKNTARETSSQKLSELFNGIATTISSGGNLLDFLNKKAETFLFEYRLDKEKQTKSAETFMDVYISIVIAAPMILTLLIVLISVTGLGIGLSMNALTFVIISIVSLINIIFLVFLHLNQPVY